MDVTHNNHERLLIGWASRDISTNKPITIVGQFHLRISRGVADPLTVTALALDNGNDAVIFLSADVALINNHLVDRVR